MLVGRQSPTCAPSSHAPPPAPVGKVHSVMACFFPHRSRFLFYHRFQNDRQQLRPPTISTCTLSAAGINKHSLQHEPYSSRHHELNQAKHTLQLGQDVHSVMACFFPDRSRFVFYHIFQNERQQLRPYTISTGTLSAAAWIATPQARPAGQSPAPKHQHASTATTIANTPSVSPPSLPPPPPTTPTPPVCT